MSLLGRARASWLIICLARTSREAGAGAMSLCTRRAKTGSATGREQNGSVTMTAQITHPWGNVLSRGVVSWPGDLPRSSGWVDCFLAFLAGAGFRAAARSGVKL
ncbi:MAG TPA: hypothetical protein VIV12_09190, partial [Streptosporangiaceae bacterium]